MATVLALEILSFGGGDAGSRKKQAFSDCLLRMGLQNECALSSFGHSSTGYRIL